MLTKVDSPDGTGFVVKYVCAGMPLHAVDAVAGRARRPTMLARMVNTRTAMRPQKYISLFLIVFLSVAGSEKIDMITHLFAMI